METGSPPPLTAEEIDLLLEGIDAWTGRENAGDLLSTMFTKIMTRGDQALQQRVEEEMRNEKAAKVLQKQEEAERAILLKAKLLQIKRHILADR